MSEPKGHWEDGGKVWVEDHDCSLPVSNTGEWQPIETAPKDGKHCILAVNEGAFVWSVQGAFQDGQWNAVHRNNVKPLCWMPNVRVPKEFLPWEKS